jgi:hypothetical protein
VRLLVDNFLLLQAGELSLHSEAASLQVYAVLTLNLPFFYSAKQRFFKNQDHGLGFCSS